MSGIYLITCTANGLIYIGATSRPFKERLREHWGELKTNTHGNPRLQNTYNKYGRDFFTVDYLEECPVDKLKETETWYIEYFKYIGADIANSAKPDDCMYDRGVRNKISETSTGRKLSEYSKQKMSKSQKEYYAKEENRRAMSKATSKKKYPNIVSPDGIVYSTEWLPEFCKTHNLEYSGVRKLLSGKSKSGHYKGWYVENNKPDNIMFSRGPRNEKWKIKQTTNSAATRNKDDFNNPLKKTVLLRDPNGTVLKITGIKKFADTNNLNSSMLSQLVNGHINRYKGWTLVTDDDLEKVA